MSGSLRTEEIVPVSLAQASSSITEKPATRWSGSALRISFPVNEHHDGRSSPLWFNIKARSPRFTGSAIWRLKETGR
jgi:hypothetical protein